MARDVVRWVGAAMAVTTILGFTPLGCGSSGGRLRGGAAGDAKIPEGIARGIRTCAAAHMDHLRSGQHSVRFDVKLANDGEVDSVALLESTFGDDELDACMAKALWSLSMADLPMHRSHGHPQEPAAPGSRALLGQVQALECLAAPPCLLAVAFFVGAAYVAVQIYVHAQSQSSTAKPKPRPVATTEPVATTTPTAIPALRKDACRDMFVVCQAKAGRCTRVNTWGHTVCRECQVDCLAGKAYGTSECYRCGFE